MTNVYSDQKELQILRRENRLLMNENKRLGGKLTSTEHATSGRFWRKLAVAGLVVLAVTLLFVGNLFFWAGNTVVKTDRYVEAVQPLIRDPAIQDGISKYATDQIFQSVDAEQLTEEVLPPRAAFLAPTLAVQLQENTDKIINKLLSRPQFQDRWDKVNENAHAKFITTIQQNGADGTINLGEFYNQISGELKNTRLAFLADKPLPPNVGSIQLAEGAWIAPLEKTINNIDTWRTIAILLLFVASISAVWISRKKRHTVILLGLLFSASMFITLISLRIARELISSKVDAQYAEAVRHAVQTIFSSLVIQSFTILALGLLVAFVAWVSGPSKNAAKLTERVRSLLNGRLHSALFSHENQFTLLIGRRKQLLQWGAIGLALSLLLFIRLTPTVLVVLTLLILFLVVALEVLSAKQPSRQLNKPSLDQKR